MNPKLIDPNEFLTVEEAIRFSKLSRSTLYHLRKNDLVKYFKVPINGETKLKSKVLMNKKSLLEYIVSFGNKNHRTPLRSN